MKTQLPQLAVLAHSAVEPTHQRKWELLAAYGWRVLLLLPPWWPEGSRHVAARPRTAGRLRVAICPAVGIGRLTNWWPVTLPSQLARFEPDLIYAEEEPFSLACWRAARIAQARNLPFVFYTYENLPRPLRWHRLKLVRRCLSAAAGAFAGNRDAQKVLRRRGFRRPIAVLPAYGVDGKVFRPRLQSACRRALGWPVAGRIVGYVGRFLPEKGVEDLIRAVAQLPDSVRLALVGAGPYLLALRLCAQQWLGERATFYPPVPRAKVATVMGALDALVLPSRTTQQWKEQFGRVLPEALACGRWVVGSSSGEIPHVLGDRRLVFPEGSPQALARKLRSLLTRRVPTALRRRALARYSDETIAGAMHRFLLRVLTHAQGRG